MPSLRASLLNGYLRMVMKSKRLDLMEPARLRDFAERSGLQILPKGVARDWVSDGAVKGEWRRPESGGADITILYLHGGGYVFGSPKTHATLTAPLALYANADVFVPVYRLAPEHPCPAAIEDAVAAYDWLLAKGVRPEKLAIAGDSAGGGLTLSTLIALRDSGRPLPACAVLYSPWTDLSCSGETMGRNAKSDAMFNRESITGGAPKYYGVLGPEHPQASPLFADLRGLPPLLVFASKSEMLHSDSQRLVEKCRTEGVSVRFEERDGLSHVWPLFHPLIPEAKDALQLSAEFIQERTHI